MADYAELTLIRGLNFLAEHQAAIANNLANVDSLGYKRRTPHAVQADRTFHSLVGEMPSVDYAERSDHRPGDIRATGDTMHVAIDGDAFLLVQDAQGGRYYTRKGEMSTNLQGQLITTSGEVILDPALQPIVARTPEGNPATGMLIRPSGRIEDGVGNEIGQIGLFGMQDKSRLQPQGAALFRDSQQAAPEPALGATLRQRHLERSNVNSLTEMVNMISVQRSFQGTARALSAVGRLKTSYIRAFHG